MQNWIFSPRVGYKENIAHTHGDALKRQRAKGYGGATDDVRVLLRYYGIHFLTDLNLK